MEDIHEIIEGRTMVTQYYDEKKGEDVTLIWDERDVCPECGIEISEDIVGVRTSLARYHEICFWYLGLRKQ